MAHAASSRAVFSKPRAPVLGGECHYSIFRFYYSFFPIRTGKWLFRLHAATLEWPNWAIGRAIWRDRLRCRRDGSQVIRNEKMTQALGQQSRNWKKECYMLRCDPISQAGHGGKSGKRRRGATPRCGWYSASLSSSNTCCNTAAARAGSRSTNWPNVRIRWQNGQLRRTSQSLRSPQNAKLPRAYLLLF